MNTPIKRGPGRPPFTEGEAVLQVNITFPPTILKKIDRLRSRKKLSRGQFLSQVIEAQHSY